MCKTACKIQPVRKYSVLKLEEYITWGASMTRTPDGKCHLFFSLWERSKGFQAWVTDSKVGYAVSNCPLGPFEFKKIILGRNGKINAWDRDVVHNPTVLYHKNKFYLYYTGNYGNGRYWSHRNNQRIGVAVAEDPLGPWQRFDSPLLDTQPNNWGSILNTNPSVCKDQKGRFVMVYKTVSKNFPGPEYGPVLHGVAFSDSPLGPFERYFQPIFDLKGIKFAAEDPYIFLFENKMFAVLKDMDSYYTTESRGLVLFESIDCIDWKLSPTPLFSGRKLKWENGDEQEFHRLERPQIYIEDGKPTILFCAVKPYSEKDDAYNIHTEITAFKKI